MESTPRRASVHSRIHFLLAYFAESILIGVLVLVPLIYTQALPTPWITIGVHIPPPSGPPAGHPGGQPARAPRHVKVDLLTAPVKIPPTIVTVVDSPESPQAENGPIGPFVPGIPNGFGGGNGDTPGGAPWGTETPPPPPPVVHAAPKPSMIRLSSGVVAAKAVYQPKPLYPQLAVMARIQGMVVLEAIIGKDGAIQDLRVLSGHPLLVRAALDAVKAWRYQPTLLNSEPVDVQTEINVTFTLGE